MEASKVAQNLKMARIFQSYYSPARYQKIMGFALNYGAKTDAWSPRWFDKPQTSIIYHGDNLVMPKHFDKQCHFECELGFVIGKTGRDISKENAMSHISHYFLVNDFTQRVMRDKFRPEGSPWCLMKGADNFCGMSDLIEKERVIDPMNLQLKLTQNGEVRQNAMTSGMIMDIVGQIENLSRYMTLNEGDMILTGSPPGQELISFGDEIACKLYQGDELLAELTNTAVMKE